MSLMWPGQNNARGVETDSCNQGIKGALESKFEEHRFGGSLLTDPAVSFQQLPGNWIDS